MTSTAADLARRLGARAEAVCRRYLSRGCREGRYWLVGDVDNTPGRSLYVRLVGPEDGPGAAGRWRDAATGQHGDLLDLMGLVCRHGRLGDTLDEARAFLALPALPLSPSPQDRLSRPRSRTSAERAARRLVAMADPLSGTLGETYLRARALDPLVAAKALRFHPRCFYRPVRADHPDVATAWPALIAPVTDLAGRQTGAHRTWLDPQGRGKAPIATPRRAMGALAGHGVRFGTPQDVLAAGEGLETILSLGVVAPDLPLVAALSSAHLAALLLPPSLRRLYIVVDPDPAGRAAAIALAQRAGEAGIQTRDLTAPQGDLNDGLRRLGARGLTVGLVSQLAPEDVDRFLPKG
ncbi:MAG: toprim domain-containing protein [Caulobacter sp.]|nr:toprim domain-containing protein [Caulobacter sp.]